MSLAPGYARGLDGSNFHTESTTQTFHAFEVHSREGSKTYQYAARESTSSTHLQPVGGRGVPKIPHDRVGETVRQSIITVGLGLQASPWTQVPSFLLLSLAHVYRTIWTTGSLNFAFLQELKGVFTCHTFTFSLQITFLYILSYHKLAREPLYQNVLVL